MDTLLASPPLEVPSQSAAIEARLNAVRRTQSRRVLGWAVALGVVGELIFDGKRLGLSVPIFVGLLLLVLRSLSGREGWSQAGSARLLLAPIGIFSLAIAVRDSPTLTTLNALAVLALGALFVQHFVGERSITQLGFARLIADGFRGAVLSPLAAPPLVVNSVNRAQLKASTRWIGPAARATAITLPILAVFTGLLVVGDDRFAQLLHLELDADQIFRAVFTLGVVGGIALVCGGALAHARRPFNYSCQTETQKPGFLRATDSLVPLLALSAVFALFGLVRLSSLLDFDKYEAAARSEFTYANEAHQSFGALMVVVVLTLITLLGFARFTRFDSSPQRTRFNVAASLLVALTAPILGCAFSRLHLYEEMYGFTELRLYASWAVLVCAGLLLWRAISLWGLDHRFGFGALAVLALGLFSLDALNPDLYIASRNVARTETFVSIDGGYLAELSADAYPVVEPWLRAHHEDDLAANYRDRVLHVDDLLSARLAQVSPRF